MRGPNDVKIAVLR